MEVSKVFFILHWDKQLDFLIFFDRTKCIEYTDIITCDLTYPKSKLKYYDIPQNFWKNWSITSKYFGVSEWQVMRIFNKVSL